MREREDETGDDGVREAIAAQRERVRASHSHGGETDAREAGGGEGGWKGREGLVEPSSYTTFSRFYPPSSGPSGDDDFCDAA